MEKQEIKKKKKKINLICLLSVYLVTGDKLEVHVPVPTKTYQCIILCYTTHK